MFGLVSFGTHGDGRDARPLPKIHTLGSLVEEAVSDTHADRKRNRLIFLLVWAAVAGFVWGAAPTEWDMPLRVLDTIVFLIVIIQWTYIDAGEHEFPLWRYFVPMMVICPGPVVIIPVYFIKSRGWGKDWLPVASHLSS